MAHASPMRVAVIGAGYDFPHTALPVLDTHSNSSPGGLATLKTLLEASTPEQPIEAVLFEA